MNITDANLAILIDTQAFVWVATRSPRLSGAATAAITDGATPLCISAVTAYEFADLNRRGRFGADLPLDSLVARLDAEILEYPASAWRIVDALPDLHRDPVDRMLIAHALHLDATLITADVTMHRYPVRCLW